VTKPISKSKSRKRKQSVEDTDENIEVEVESSQIAAGAVQTFVQSICIQEKKSCVDLYQVSGISFSGAFSDKCLCQFAEFVCGLVSSSPATQLEFAAGLTQVSDEVLAAAIECDERKAVSDSASAKNAPVIRMRLVQEDDEKVIIESTSMKTKFSYHSRVLSILSWVSISIHQLVTTTETTSAVIQRLHSDWSKDKTAKTARAWWHGGLLRVFGGGQIDAQVQWVKRAISATALAGSDEETVRAVGDHYSYLFLQQLFRTTQGKNVGSSSNESNSPSPESISVLCGLL